MGRFVLTRDMDRVEDRLAKIELRQEATVQAVNRVLDSLETQTELLRELLEWANKPASSDLADALQKLEIAIRTLFEQVAAMPALVSEAVAERLR